ncbi:MAG: mandelate racemase [Armatimonadetes bacterium]|nr:mandelate racemase [Armatimonadota bacterium]
MKITQADVYPLRFPMRDVLHIARGPVGDAVEGAQHVYVRLTADTGEVGWGECRPVPRWSYETFETAVSTLRRYLVPAVLGRDPFDLAGLHAAMDVVIAPGPTVGQPVAKNAIDMAVHDLIGRATGVPVQALMGAARARELPVCWIVSKPTAEEAHRVAGEGAARGFRAFKVKVGHDPVTDADMLRAALDAVPSDCYVWADANAGYSLADAKRLERRIRGLGVAVLEQPLAANAWLDLRELRAKSEIPLALDESVYTPADLLQLVRLEALDILVLKLGRMAGLYGSRRAAEMALDAGLTLLGSGLTESRLSLAASTHLMTAFGVPAADLNGPQFLADDATPGSLAPLPSLPLPAGPGLGVTPDPEKLRRYADEA